ncbi:Wzz/FepE/Etk N-terminal domain-containing protein [Streptacidiphilus sp. N1-3]|uniref:Wzz/FepE/Etk N-terminal domain-containing protein n=1 Tax=Streptacidiphilus alkalitolerans TaxID=3342712 RepID=A0ABV6X9T1_9ACTN
MPDSSRTAVGSILRRCWPLVAAVPLGAVCGGAYALVAPVEYQANAYVMVVPETTGDSSTAVDFAQAYGRVITQPEILLDAAASTGVPVAQLAPLVQAVTSPDAPMIQITGSAGSAARSAKEANAVADSLVSFGNAASKQTRVKLLTFAAAALPDRPSSPSRTLDLAVGAAAGLLVGGLGTMARQSLSGNAGNAGNTADAAGTALPLPRSTEAATEAAAEPVPELEPVGAEADGADGAAPAESRHRRPAAQGRR